MTSDQAQLQALIAEIESLLGQGTPRLPWSAAGEPSQQRRLLERALASLRAFQAIAERASTDRETLGDAAIAPPATTANSEVASQQVLQALLQEMQYLRSQTIQPLTNEVATLQQQRERLQDEVRQLESARSQLTETNAFPQANPVWVNTLVDQLQSSLLEQLAPQLKALQARAEDAPALYGAADDPREIAADLPQLHPQQRLTQLRQIQSQTDHLLLRLDANLRAVFEAMEQSVQSYCDSLAQGLETMHGLGQQGEVIFGAFINHLAQQMRQDASYLSSGDREEATGLLEGQDRLYRSYDKSALTDESLALEDEDFEEDPLLQSIINLDDVDLDEDSSGEEITLFQLDDDITQLRLEDEDEIDGSDYELDDLDVDEEPTVLQVDEERTLIQTEPMVWGDAIGLATSETESAATETPATAADIDADTSSDYAEEIDALYESLFGEEASIAAAEAEEGIGDREQERDAEEVEEAAQAALEATLFGADSSPGSELEGPRADSVDGGTVDNSEAGDGAIASPTEVPSAAVDASFDTLLESLDSSPAEAAGSDLEDVFEETTADSPTLNREPESETVLATFMGTEVAAELTPDEAPSLAANTIASLDELLPAPDMTEAQSSADPFAALDEPSEDTFIAAPLEEDLLASEVEATLPKIDLSLDEAALEQLNEDLSQLEEAPSEGLLSELSEEVEATATSAEFDGPRTDESQLEHDLDADLYPESEIRTEPDVENVSEAGAVFETGDLTNRDQPSDAEALAKDESSQTEAPSSANAAENEDSAPDPSEISIDSLANLDLPSVNEIDAELSEETFEGAIAPAIPSDNPADPTVENLDLELPEAEPSEKSEATDSPEAASSGVADPEEVFSETVLSLENLEASYGLDDASSNLAEPPLETIFGTEPETTAEVPLETVSRTQEEDVSQSLEDLEAAVSQLETIQPESSDVEVEAEGDSTPIIASETSEGSYEDDSELEAIIGLEVEGESIVEDLDLSAIFSVESDGEAGNTEPGEGDSPASEESTTDEPPPTTFESDDELPQPGSLALGKANDADETTLSQLFEGDLFGGEPVEDAIDSPEINFLLGQDVVPTPEKALDSSAPEVVSESSESSETGLANAADSLTVPIAPSLPDFDDASLREELPMAGTEDAPNNPAEQAPSGVPEALNDLEGLAELIDGEAATAATLSSEATDDTEAMPGFLNDLALPSEDISLDLDILEASTEAPQSAVGAVIPDDPDSSEDLDSALTAATLPVDEPDSLDSALTAATLPVDEPDSALNTAATLDVPDVAEADFTAPEAILPVSEPDGPDSELNTAATLGITDVSEADSPKPEVILSEEEDEASIAIVDSTGTLLTDTEAFSLEVDLNLSLDSVPEGKIVDSPDEIANVEVAVSEADLGLTDETRTNLDETDTSAAETDRADAIDSAPPQPVFFTVEGSATEGYRLATDEAVLDEFIETTLADLSESSTVFDAVDTPEPTATAEAVYQTAPQPAFEVVGSDEEGFSLRTDPNTFSRQLEDAIAEIPAASEDDFLDRQPVEGPSPTPASTSAINPDPLSDEEMAELLPFLSPSADSDTDAEADPADEEATGSASSEIVSDEIVSDEIVSDEIPAIDPSAISIDVSQALLDILETEPETAEPETTSPVTDALASELVEPTSVAAEAETFIGIEPLPEVPDAEVPSVLAEETGLEPTAGPLSDDELAQLFPPTTPPADDPDAVAAPSAFLVEEAPLEQALDLDLLDDVAERLDNLAPAIAEPSAPSGDLEAATGQAADIPNPDLESTTVAPVTPEISTLANADVADAASADDANPEEADANPEEAAIADFTLEDVAIPLVEESATEPLSTVELDELFPPLSEDTSEDAEASDAAIAELFPTTAEGSDLEDDLNRSELPTSADGDEARNRSEGLTNPEATDIVTDELEDTGSFADIFDAMSSEELPGALADSELDSAEADISVDDLGLSSDLLDEDATAEEAIADDAGAARGDTTDDAVTADEHATILDSEIDADATEAADATEVPPESFAFVEFDLSMEEIPEADIENDEAFHSAFQASDQASDATEDGTTEAAADIPEDLARDDVMGTEEDTAEATVDVTEDLERDVIPEGVEDSVPEGAAKASEDPNRVEQVSLPSLDALFEDEDEEVLEAVFAESVPEATTDESLDDIFGDETLGDATTATVSETSDDTSLDDFFEDTPEAATDSGTATTSAPAVLDAESLEAAFAEDTSEASDDLGLDDIFGEELPETETETLPLADAEGLANTFADDISDPLDGESLDDIFGGAIAEGDADADAADAADAAETALEGESLAATFADDISDPLDGESLEDIFGGAIAESEPEPEPEPAAVQTDVNETPTEAVFTEDTETEPETASTMAATATDIDQAFLADLETVDLTTAAAEDAATSALPTPADLDLEDVDQEIEAAVDVDSDLETAIAADANDASSEPASLLTDPEELEAISARDTRPVEAPVSLPDMDVATEADVVEEAASTSALLATLPVDEPATHGPESPATATPIRDEWFLGIDFGTGGLSAVLMNRVNGAAHPLYWSYRGSNASGENTFRLPTVAALQNSSGGPELQAVGVAALIEAAKDTNLQLLNTLKPLLRVGIPHQIEADQWEPMIQWSDEQLVPLQKMCTSVQALLTLLRQSAGTPLELDAVGLGHGQVHQVLADLHGIVVGHPTSWPDTYCTNLREAVLAARLVEEPSQIFFVEEAIAAILSGLPDPNDPPPPQGRQTQTLYQCTWQGGTVVISAGASCTELGIVDLPHPLDAVSREDFVLRNLIYGGDALDLDIICQLLLPSERQKSRASGDRRAASTGGWQPRFPEAETAQWSSLDLDSLELPQLAEPDVSKRIRLRQHLEASKLGQSVLEAARHLKLILQNQPQFQLELADQSWRVLRRDLESRVLVPYIQRLNQQLNALLSQTGLASQSINQVICTGGNVSFATIAKWLRQKFPNATIIQDTYPINRSPSCSRVAYGLVNLCRYPQVLDVPRHQYSDYFLLHEIIRTVPDQPLPLDGILHLLEEQGLNTDACRTRILAILEGHLPPGLVPENTTNPYLSQATVAQSVYQNLVRAPLFTRQSEDIYMLDAQQRDRIRNHLATLLLGKRQSLAEPLIAQLVIP